MHASLGFKPVGTMRRVGWIRELEVENAELHQRLQGTECMSAAHNFVSVGFAVGIAINVFFAFLLGIFYQENQDENEE